MSYTLDELRMSSTIQPICTYTHTITAHDMHAYTYTHNHLIITARHDMHARRGSHVPPLVASVMARRSGNQNEDARGSAANGATVDLAVACTQVVACIQTMHSSGRRHARTRGGM